MSPAPLSNLAAAVSPSTIAGPAPLPVFTNWQNPLPDTFRALDGRNHFLQSDTSEFLEMHPNGTRGVDKRTEYGILTILVVNLTATIANWMKDSKNGGRSSSDAQHLIRANRTGFYLCMDDHSALYQSKDVDMNHCLFTNEYNRTSYRVTYHRNVNGSKWYVGVNRDGSIRCGNITRRNQKSANFNKIAPTMPKDTASPPFVKQRKDCCPRKRCGRRSKCPPPTKDPGIRAKTPDAEIVEGEQTVCRRTYFNWCRKHRRQFFKLKLKDLKRYYNRCIKKNRNKGCSRQRHKVRHCKDR